MPDEARPAVVPARPQAPRRSRRAHHPARRAMVRGTRAVSTLIALVLVVGSGLTFIYFNRLSSQSAVAQSPKQVEGNVAAEGIDGRDLDILMIGTDTRTGTDIPADGDTGDDLRNTDTIMLIHVPADGSKASVVSFPRDTWVPMPGGGKARINAAYPLGYASVTDPNATEQQRKDAGQKALIQTVSALSGVQIDHFVEVTLAGFRDLTKAVGGIDVNLCEPTQDLQYSGADFPAGPQHLNETQALAFVRQRHGIGSDLNRIKRQQYFMGAMLRKVLDRNVSDLLNPVKLAQLIDALAGTITYDTDLDPLLLAEQMNNVATGNVSFYTIPIAGDLKVDGQQVLAPVSSEKMLDFFRSLSWTEPTPADGKSPPPTTPNVAPIPVQLYVGTDVAGAAQTASADLQARGYTVESTTTATGPYDVTEIQYAPGMADAATALAAALPGSTTREISSAPAGKLLVIVADNYPGLAVDAPSAPAPPNSTAADEGCIY